MARKKLTPKEKKNKRDKFLKQLELIQTNPRLFFQISQSVNS